MGLDMYLTKKKYVKNWSHMGKDELSVVTVEKGGKLTKLDKASYVEEEYGYWRKANAIHSWFVQNVQGGDDNCASYYVSREKLVELLGLVEGVLSQVKLVPGKVHNGTQYKDGKKTEIWENGKVIDKPEICHELLPCAEGFFFGGTDYDQWYYEDLVETKKILTEALKSEDDGHFEYQSSW